MAYKLVDTDKLPGRAQFLETRDCSVKAVAAGTGIPYPDVFDAARRAGRKHRQGFWTSGILSQLVEDGKIKFERTHMYDRDVHAKHRDRVEAGEVSYHQWRARNEYPTLAQAMPLMQSGRYVVTINSHALAVVDGVIYDNLTTRGGPRLRTRVHDIYEVTTI